MSRYTRKAKGVFHVAASRVSSTSICLELHGDTSAGNTVILKGEMPWYFIPYLVDALQKQWIIEKTSCLSEIQRIDESLPQK